MGRQYITAAKPPKVTKSTGSGVSSSTTKTASKEQREHTQKEAKERNCWPKKTLSILDLPVRFSLPCHPEVEEAASFTGFAHDSSTHPSCSPLHP